MKEDDIVVYSKAWALNHMYNIPPGKIEHMQPKAANLFHLFVSL
jgi:hypothetical protein